VLELLVELLARVVQLLVVDVLLLLAQLQLALEVVLMRVRARVRG